MARGEVRGAKRAAQVLRALSRAITPATVRQAHQRAFEPMQTSAAYHFMANGSYVTGVIPNDIAILHTAPLETRMGMIRMGAKLGHIIEFGTAPHYQPMRRVNHPGASPKPFMRPAFDDKADDAIRIAGSIYGAELGRIAALLNRR